MEDVMNCGKVMEAMARRSHQAKGKMILVAHQKGYVRPGDGELEGVTVMASGELEGVTVMVSGWLGML